MDTKLPIQAEVPPDYLETYTPQSQIQHTTEPIFHIEYPPMTCVRKQFINVTPLQRVGPVPTPVDCPACGSRDLTRTKYVAGCRTHCVAVLLFMTTVIFAWAPYVYHHTKDVVHSCAHCRAILATWVRGRRRVEVYQNF